MNFILVVTSMFWFMLGSRALAHAESHGYPLWSTALGALLFLIGIGQVAWGTIDTIRQRRAYNRTMGPR
jgi:hypothetical protein